MILLPLILNCTLTGIRIKDAAVSGKNVIVLATEEKGSSSLLTLSNNNLVKRLYDIQPDLEIREISFLTDESLMVITEKKGIIVFPAEGNPIHIEVGEKKLPDHRIRGAYYYSYGQKQKLYVTYFTPGGTGVTECTIGENWNIIEYRTFNKLNSDLKNNYVHEITSDLKGNLWFRYSEIENIGISSLDSNGKWKYYNKMNSELGDSSVSIIRVENRDAGFAGDNIWFASLAGLSKLQYNGEKDEWKLYGEKQTFTNTALRHIGLQSYFTDAIIDIVDLCVLKDSILIANKKAVYHFTPDNINRFIPESVIGIDNLRITGILFRKGHICTIIRDPESPEQFIRSVMLYNMDERKWSHLKYWDLARAFAVSIHFLPNDEDSELLVFTYKTGPSKFAVYNYKSGELKEFIPVYNAD